MPLLPTGTVTFLFTDIEGSTRLLRRAFEDRDGVEVQDHGDGFYYRFPSAKAGVEAAVESQRAVAGHAWPDGATVRIRMGLHTGVLEESLAAFRDFEDREGLALMLYENGLLGRDQGDLPRATALLREGLTLAHEGEDQPSSIRSLEALATVAAALERHKQAVWLLGFATARREAMGTPLPPADRPAVNRTLAAARAGLEEVFAAAWAVGTAMSVDQAMEDAMRDTS